MADGGEDWKLKNTHKDLAKEKNKTQNNQTHTHANQRKTKRHTDNRNQICLEKKKGIVL